MKFFSAGFNQHYRSKEKLLPGSNPQHELRRNDNNIILFLESENYLCFGSNQTSTTAALYNTYQVWCEDNFYEPFKK